MIIALFVATFLLIWLVWWLHRPLSYTRLWDSEKIASFTSDPQRKVGNVPTAFPRGWYRICWSVEMSPKGRPLIVRAFDATFSVLRKEDGQAVVARLVSENPPSSPDHRSAASIPVPVLELLGCVLVWHGSASPDWTPPFLEQLHQSGLVFHGCTEHHVGCGIQDVAENGPDTAHLSYLHHHFMFPFLPGAYHRWDSTSWVPGEGKQAHVAFMKLTQSSLWLGRVLPFSTVSVDIFQIGMGLVLIKYHLPPLLPAALGGRPLKLYMLESVTPVSRLLQRAGHIGWGERGLPRLIAKLVLAGSISHFERDIPIWSKKTYVSAPLLVKGDGPIAQYRRWITRFYS